jgi:outer membrane protein assembly factor BamD (BamD/ComL family)
VLVEGECVREISKGEPGDWSALRLQGRAKPGDAKALSEVAKALSLGDVSDVREVTLFGASPPDKRVNGLFCRIDGGKMLFCYKDLTGAFLWERATKEDLAAQELKSVMSKRSLAEKKQALDEFIAQYPSTQAAETARQELERMPSGEEIREIDAAGMLEIARAHLRAEYLAAAKGTFQGVMDNYPGTQAAETAKKELQRMPSEAEIHEMEAARELRSIKKQLESCHDRKQKLTKASRERVKASAEQRLRRLITYYPGTKAAAEAKRLVDPATQREKRAAELLRLAKMLLSNNPQAGEKRLKELVTEFAGTKAAEEAQQLLGQAE